MADQWTSFDRVKTSLNHSEPDRIPFDLGGSILTGMHEQAYRRLCAHLGLGEVDVAIEDNKQQLALIDEDVKERLKVDVYGVNPSHPSVFKAKNWSEDGYDKATDEWGIEWWMPQVGGFYYDMRRHPMVDVTDVKELDDYNWPDPLDPDRYEGMAEKAHDYIQNRKLATILGRNAPGISEISLWLRGFEGYYTDMVLNEPLAEALLDKVCDIKMQYWEKALELVGDDVLIVSEADDLASQDSLLVSPEMYRKFIKPRHTRLFSHIKKCAKVDVKIFYHCCGAAMPIIGDLIESGVDILNPVQVSAKGMDSKELKRRFGNDITFYGGGVDTQRILPHGSPQEIRDEVKRRIDDFAPGGGFVFNPVHNVQADVPPENYMAMWDALQEFGSYQ